MKIITVGKKSKNWVSEAVGTYSKRLQGNFKIEWNIIPNSGAKSPEQALKQESEHILNRLSPTDFVILLDETGKNISSPELSDKLVNNQNVVFVIGGAYGVDISVKNRANFIWSLSKLVFPHQIVRLILTEQIYRAQMISQNHPYHHI